MSYQGVRNFWFYVVTALLRTLFIIMGWRPSSYPYISGDGFRKISNHIYDERNSFQTGDIKNGDIVFVKTDFLDVFFKDVHPNIKYPYKLITHNSDRNIVASDLLYIDDKIIHWFAQNLTIYHEKITPLPIGLENLYYFNNGITAVFDWMKSTNPIKKNTIIFGFNINTNKLERSKALMVLRKSNSTSEITNTLNPFDYLKFINRHRFIASPKGNGIDCHRTWEALYLGVIPIVTNSVAIRYFKKIGIPMVILDNWNDLDTLRLDDYSYIESPVIYMDYWERLIKNTINGLTGI